MPLLPVVGSSRGFTPVDVPQAEADALIALYNATDGANWTDNTNWLTDTTVGNWYGITVVGGHVEDIDLPTNGLSGSVSSWFSNDAGDLTAIDVLLIQNNSISGDISGYVIPATLGQFDVSNTSVSGDLSTWALLSLIVFNVDSTSLSGTPPALNTKMRTYNVGQTSMSGVPAVTSMRDIRVFDIEDLALSEANVDTLLEAIYDRWASLLYSAPALRIGGTNATPSGVYQDGDPPTTGLEWVYELANDPEATGNNTWSITYNGGSAP